jgi:transcriptional regulator with XRE-family HTH domain
VSVGQRLTLLRKRKNLSQEKVARIIGVDRTTYNRYESDKTQPDFKILSKLIDYYGVSYDFLFRKSNTFEFFTQEHGLICLADLKVLLNKLENYEVEIDIPKSRVPYVIDSLRKEILVIETQLNREKISPKRRIHLKKSHS